MKKFIRVKMPDCSVWSVPAYLVSENRAKYYLDRGDFKTMREAMKVDDFELLDWAESNMDWSDVAARAVCVKQGETDYEEGWCNGDKELTDEEPPR